MAILTPDDYDAVRAALDTTLDDELLPDSVIGLSIYVDAAELEIKRRDSDAESRTGDDAKRIKNATIYMVAALIAPALPRIVSETIGESSYRRQDVDWQAVARDLRSRSDEELVRVIESDPVTSARPTIFSRATGQRGR